MLPGFPRPLLFAHRGASLHAPENTLAAFELGARLGADVLELDVHLSRDGIPMVIHDPMLERTTNGHGRVGDFTAAELQALDAGHCFLRAGEHAFRGCGATIPRLAEVLTAFPRQAFNIDLKQSTPSLVRPVLDALSRIGPRAVILTSHDDAVMVEIEAAQPGCALGLARGQAREVVKRAWRGASLEAYRGRALQIPPTVFGFVPLASALVVQRAHAAGIEVHVWTINDPRRAEALFARGCDGVMTDDPARLCEIVERWRQVQRRAPT